MIIFHLTLILPLLCYAYFYISTLHFTIVFITQLVYIPRCIYVYLSVHTMFLIIFIHQVSYLNVSSIIEYFAFTTCSNLVNSVNLALNSVFTKYAQISLIEKHVADMCSKLSRRFLGTWNKYTPSSVQERFFWVYICYRQAVLTTFTSYYHNKPLYIYMTCRYIICCIMKVLWAGNVCIIE